MAQVQLEKHIHAPKARVFEVFADLENAADRIKGIKTLQLLTPAPVGAGTKFRETRIMFKKEATEEMEITAFEPPESYRVEAHSHGSHYLTTYRFSEQDDGTLVSMVFEARPISLFAKLFSIFAGLMMGPVKKCLEEDMDDLKTFLENPAT